MKNEINKFFVSYKIVIDGNINYINSTITNWNLEIDSLIDELLRIHNIEGRNNVFIYSCNKLE